ncbi:hypothetical protein VTK56DRAFT_5879 [Thermocarpiscus australiensis]
MTLANIISRDLHDITAIADKLRAWAKAIDPAVYAEKQMGNLEDWPPAAQSAYKNYKAAVDALTAAQAAYNKYNAANRNTTDPDVCHTLENAYAYAHAQQGRGTPRIKVINRSAVSAGDTAGPSQPRSESANTYCMGLAIPH